MAALGNKLRSFVEEFTFVAVDDVQLLREAKVALLGFIDVCTISGDDRPFDGEWLVLFS